MQRSAGRFDRRDVAVFERGEDRARGGVDRRQNRKPERPHQQAEGIKPADGRRAEECGYQSGDQHNVFARLPSLVAIRLNALLAALGLRGHIAHEVLQRAHGADPAAEEAPQKECRHEYDEAPDQPAIQRMASQRVDQSHQRVPLEEEPHRRAQMNLSSGAGKEAPRSEEQQPEKEQQENNLRNPAQHRQSGPVQESPPHARTLTVHDR